MGHALLTCTIVSDEQRWNVN